jgi:chemotaxis protein CheZ
MVALLAADPVAAVAKGHVMNFLTDLERTNTDLDQHLTEIMMAQDFHDLTGQVIARVLNLASNIEDQLVALLIQTAPADVQERLKQQTEQMDVEKAAAKTPLTPDTVILGGPVVNPEKMASEVVTDQSQVDDLLASLGF